MQFPIKKISVDRQTYLRSVYRWYSSLTTTTFGSNSLTPNRESYEIILYPNSLFLTNITVISPDDISAKISLNGYPILPLKINEESILNLPYVLLTFVDKQFILNVPLKKMDKDLCLSIIEESLYRELKSASCGFATHLDFWNNKAIEFLSTCVGICEDYPVNGGEQYHNHVSREIAPCMYKKINEEIDGHFPCSTSLKRECELFYTSTKHPVECDEGIEGCLVAHYKIKYHVNDEQMELRKKFNSNTLPYCEVLSNWERFYDKTLKELVDNELKNAREKLILDNEEMISFPPIPNVVVFIESRDLTEEEMQNGRNPMIWSYQNKDYIITSGFIADLTDEMRHSLL